MEFVERAYPPRYSALWRSKRKGKVLVIAAPLYNRLNMVWFRRVQTFSIQRGSGEARQLGIQKSLLGHSCGFGICFKSYQDRWETQGKQMLAADSISYWRRAVRLVCSGGRSNKMSRLLAVSIRRIQEAKLHKHGNNLQMTLLHGY